MLFDLPNRLFQEFSNSIKNAEGDLSQSQLRSLFEAGLKRAQLVTREEFDAQQAVLLRTREKVEAMEQQVAQLEALIATKES